jgi:benzil reductase ((S)-benzoin forming)
LGLALAKALLARNEHVIGIGRSTSLEHPNFRFISCDLSRLEDIQLLGFPVLEGPVTLINNAGILGEIGRISQLESPDFDTVLTVNTLAPYYLTRALYSRLSEPENFTLVNISSGAAKRSIPSWAAYCASKAALDRWTENFYLEELELGRALKVYAVAPGVIDTDMQAEIRNVDETVFSAHQNFVALKANDQLYSPEYAAELLLKLLENEHEGQVCMDLRQL